MATNESASSDGMVINNDQVLCNSGLLNAKSKRRRLLHTDRKVERLIQRANNEGISVEMTAILGFLLDSKPAFITEILGNDCDGIFRHDYGYAFTCLKIFRDWCKVSPRRRAEWCKNRSLDNGVFENVCNFVTTVREKLFPDDTNKKMASFQKERKATEKKIMLFFMEEMFGGLAVYSGCPVVGYVRLEDGNKIRIPLAANAEPKKFALLFELTGSCMSKKPRKSYPCKCTLYPPEDLVMKYLKDHNQLHGYKDLIVKYYNQLQSFTVDVLPAVLKKCFRNVKDCQDFEYEVREENVCSNNCYSDSIKDSKSVTVYMWKSDDDKAMQEKLDAEKNIYIVPDFSKNCLTIYCLKSDEEEVKEIVQEKLDAEKKKLVSSVKTFGYPKKHGGLQVSLKPGGEVENITPTPSGGSEVISLDILARGDVVLDNEDAFKHYGELEKLDRDSDVLKPKQNVVYLWGKLHCKSLRLAEEAMKICNNEGYPFCHCKNIQLAWPRPDLSVNSTGVKYVRVNVKQMVRKVKQVNLYLHDTKWQPNKHFYMLGKNQCKVKWFGDGTGAFTLPQPLMSDKKIFAAVREAFGWNLDIEIIRHNAPKAEHTPFDRDRCLSNIVYHNLQSGKNVRIVLDSDFHKQGSVYREDVIDFFDVDTGERFFEAFRKEKPVARRNAGLFISSVEHCIAMVVKEEVFHCVKEGIDVVRETADRNHMNTDITVEETNTEMQRVKVTGKDKDIVNKVGAVIGRVIQPEIIRGMGEGSSKRDETENVKGPPQFRREDAFLFFKSSGGQAYIKNKVEAVYEVKIVFHPVDEVLYIYGPPEGKHNAKMRLLQYANEHLVKPVSFLSEGDSQVPCLILQKLLRQKFGNDLDGLRHKAGITSACWESSKGCVMVWGNSEAVEKVKEMIDEMQSQMSSIFVGMNMNDQCCVACLSPVDGFPFKVSLCGHVYCTECIKLHVTLAMKDKSLPIRCGALSPYWLMT